MSSWVVRVEAVNFGATILDTNDLSTIRGGGLAALFIGDPVGGALASVSKSPPEPIFSGASQAAFRIESDAPEAAVGADVERAVRERMRTADGRNGEAPHAFIMYVIDTVRLAGPADRRTGGD